MTLLAGLQTGPDAAVVVFAAGILFIYLECNRPGWIVPGCLGALLTLLSVNAFAHMPLQAAALALLAAGIILLLTEVVVYARNLIAASGTALLAMGFRTLVRPSGAAQVHTSIAMVAGVGLGATTLWLARIALRARRNKRTLFSLPPVRVASQRRIAAPHRID